MKKHFSLVILLSGMVSFFIGNVHARDMMGVTFPETVIIEGTPCKLQGIGVRKKLIINVYLGVLYLAGPTSNDAEVIGTDQIKRITMHFLYKEVKPDQLVDAWNEGFANNAGDQVQSLKTQITAFNALFNEPVKQGDAIILTYIPGKGTEVQIKNSIKGIIEGQAFMRALFSIWFGMKPPSKSLKEGMLGL